MMKAIKIIAIVSFCLLINTCDPLPPAKVVVVFSDDRKGITCDEIEPLFSQIGSSMPIGLTIDTKIGADTCVWKGTVDVKSTGSEKFSMVLHFSGKEFGNTVVYIDTTTLANTTGGVLYDLTLARNHTALFDAKKIPLYSRISLSWDTLYILMDSYSH